MKKRSAVLVVCLVAGLTLTAATGLVAQGKGANPKGKPFIELQGQIIQVEGELASLQDQIDSLVGRADTMEERLAADERILADLFVANQALSQQLDESVAGIQADIDALGAQNAELQRQIDDNTGDIESHAAQIATNNTLIIALEQSIWDPDTGLAASLQAQIENNSDLIVVLEDEIADLNELLPLMALLENGECPSGYALSEIRSDGAVECESVTGGAAGGLETEHRFAWKRVDPGQTVFVKAVCRSGWVVTGGGFIHRNIEITDSWPFHSWVGEESFRTRGKNVGTYNTFLEAYAVCMRLVP